MKTAIYPGSFDPITLGHLDILKRACNLFDCVYIVIMKNSKKNCLLSEDERKLIIEDAIKEAGIKNAFVEIGSGLTVNYAKEKQADVIIRGLRAMMDFEFELQIASANSHLDSTIETIFIPTKPELSFVSSSVVKEIAMAKKRVDGLVPSMAADLLEKKYQEED